jgi:hypothetical protein
MPQTQSQHSVSLVRRVQAVALRLVSDTQIVVSGTGVTVRGKHRRQRRVIGEALESFLPGEGVITITGRRVQVYGSLAESEQAIRNVLHIELSPGP